MLVPPLKLRGRRTLRSALILAALTMLTASESRAHFNLVAPASSTTQDNVGNPQKSAPCGPSGLGTPTGAVTVYKPGDTISVTIRETVYHPGHYRVSVAADQASLPPDPPVKVGASECGSTEIVNNPTLPILKDGALLHSAPFNGPQTFQVQLPPNFTCNKCSLQILEFMSSHGAPCFYYHCATITVVAPDGGGGGPDAAPALDAAPVSADAAVGERDASSDQDGGTIPPGTGGGCSCQVGARGGVARTDALGLLAIGLVGVGLRRRWVSVKGRA